MLKYYVESGSLQLTIFAASTYEAALEAVHWWEERGELTGKSYRGSLAEEVRVRRSRTSGEARRYITGRLVAQHRRQSFRQMLQELLCAA
jgi:hypothetical protein